VDEKLITYVKLCLDKGFPRDTIAVALKKHGHSDNDIRDVFNRVDSDRGPLQGKQQKSFKKLFFVINMILIPLVVILIVFVVYLLFSQPKDDSYEASVPEIIDDFQPQDEIFYEEYCSMPPGFECEEYRIDDIEEGHGTLYLKLRNNHPFNMVNVELNVTECGDKAFFTEEFIEENSNYDVVMECDNITGKDFLVSNVAVKYALDIGSGASFLEDAGTIGMIIETT